MMNMNLIQYLQSSAEFEICFERARSGENGSRDSEIKEHA